MVTVPAVPGAVNKPLDEIVPADADQVTVFVELPVTWAENCWVWLTTTVGVAGVTNTLIGVTVTVAEPETDVFAVLVAVTE
jgi:hypothetical protein